MLGTSDADVKVLYADYGNIETLPLCRVQPISASHLELPFQIIKCSLDGRQLSHFPVWVSVGFFFFLSSIAVSLKQMVISKYQAEFTKKKHNTTRVFYSFFHSHKNYIQSFHLWFHRLVSKSQGSEILVGLRLQS